MQSNKLQKKKILVLGTGGSGKTVFATRKLWASFKCPIAYDINGDYSNLKGGITYPPEDIEGELIPFLRKTLEMSKKRKIDAIFFDDADCYIDYKTMENHLFKDLVIRQRNPKYAVTLVFIGKRPQNLPTKVIEGCHVMFLYKTEGHNAMQRLGDIDPKIVPMLEEVYTKEYSYIEKWEGYPPVLKKPIKL